MVVVDETGTIVEANRAAMDLAHTNAKGLIGLRTGTALGCQCASDSVRGCGFGPRCAACPMLGAIRQTLATNRGVHNALKTLTFFTDDGQPVRRILGVSTAPLKQSPPRVLIVLDDVTQRIAAEEALAESESRFRQLAENIHEVFWIVDTITHRQIYISPAYETIWGRPRKHLLDNPNAWIDAIVPEDRPQVLAAIAHRDEFGFSAEYRIRRPNGEIRWIFDRAFVVRNAAKEPVRVVGIAEDITRYKHAQELAIRQQADFVHLARVNTMGQLGSGLAHEINQPLGAIANYAGACRNFLAQTPLPRKQIAAAIDSILGEAHRAADVVTRLRALVNKRPTARKACSLRALTDQAIRLLQPHLSHAEVTIKKSFPRNLAQIKVDSVQIIQVLINLLQNSIDALAAKPHHRRIFITARRRKARTLTLSITDNGPGISPHQFAQLFVPFRTTKSNGLGIGLNICRTIIESHGGHIEAANRPAGGLVVEVTLPVTPK